MSERPTHAPGARPGPDASSAPDPRPVGWRAVLLLAAAVVALVLGLAVVTSLLPAGLQAVVFRTPLLIVVLVAGTVGLLVALARRGPGAR